MQTPKHWALSQRNEHGCSCAAAALQLLCRPMRAAAGRWRVHTRDCIADCCPSHVSLPQYAFNLFSHTTKVGDNGYNEEEMKMVKETRKIWGVRTGTAASKQRGRPPSLPTHTLFLYSARLGAQQCGCACVAPALCGR